MIHANIMYSPKKVVISNFKKNVFFKKRFYRISQSSSFSIKNNDVLNVFLLLKRKNVSRNLSKFFTKLL